MICTINGNLAVKTKTRIFYNILPLLFLFFDHLKGEDPAEELASETGTAEPTLEMSVSEVMRAFWPGCSLPRSTRSSMCDRGGPGGAGGGGRGG